MGTRGIYDFFKKILENLIKMIKKFIKMKKNTDFFLKILEKLIKMITNFWKT